MNNTRRASHGLAEFVQREYLSADVADSGTKSYSGEVGSSLGTISSDRLESSERYRASIKLATRTIIVSYSDNKTVTMGASRLRNDMFSMPLCADEAVTVLLRFTPPLHP